MPVYHNREEYLVKSLGFLFSVLKADAAFLSLETNGPAELRRYLIDNLAIRVLLCCDEQVRILVVAIAPFSFALP